jgi:hypothetical protein
MKYILIILLTFLLSSCIDFTGDSEPFHPVQTTVYEYSMRSGEIKTIKVMGVGETNTFLKYFHNSNKKIISQYYSFFIIDEESNEEEININPVFIGNSYYFDISPDNNSIIFGGSILDGNNFIDNGLYRLDLTTRNLELLYHDENASVLYPAYSSTGDKIVFCTRGQGNGQEVGSKVLIFDITSKEAVIVDSNNFSILRYARFSENDLNIYYYEAQDKIYQYNIESGIKTLIIERDNFALNYDLTNEFPLFNLTENSIFFMAADSSLDRFSPYFIYEFDISDSIITNKFSGRQPMSISENYILFRDEVCSECGYDTPSNLKLSNINNLNGGIVISLGNYGTISDDEKYILFTQIVKL